MLDESSAGTVHHALRQSGRSRRIHDIDRVIERQALECRRRIPLAWAQKLLPACCTRDFLNGARGVSVRYNDDLRDRGDSPCDGCCALERIDFLPSVAITIRAEKNPRLNLTEPIEHTLHSEIGRAGRPDSADPGRAEHRDYGLRDVRQKACDAIPRFNTSSSKR